MKRFIVGFEDFHKLTKEASKAKTVEGGVWCEITTGSRAELVSLAVLRRLMPSLDECREIDPQPQARGARYAVRDSEAGNLIETFGTVEEAKAEVERYEAIDKEEGTYTPGFYEVYDQEEEEVVL